MKKFEKSMGGEVGEDVSTGHHLTFEFLLGKGRIPTIQTPLKSKEEADLIRRVLKRERNSLRSNPKDENKAAELIQWYKAMAKRLLGISEDETCRWKVIEVDGKGI